MSIVSEFFYCFLILNDVDIATKGVARRRAWREQCSEFFVSLEPDFLSNIRFVPFG
jgi:hypothetical protein